MQCGWDAYGFVHPEQEIFYKDDIQILKYSNWAKARQRQPAQAYLYTIATTEREQGLDTDAFEMSFHGIQVL
ncbi:hypothetical protein PtrSN002B_005159 [Pyrenophora tritici-repentis]|nr:hypothetical protein PtrSN001C_008767 [Pyrenophora tritici-repentis]KAI1548209.1 hypothetical protein PtrSN001A_001302 [Pyrenophora tritici-repentis]KAI1552356.1 hypothetical protein PtrSN002B_005159 [Pyrenophora tritici-repentis]KAI1564030.1 hypothetical protein PtrEW4_009065 [Pyrenophora tritici-repentis]KAI1597389.1 hypothetical protein PtrCC142_008912 [Pyrenophora tritici-repentis]